MAGDDDLGRRVVGDEVGRVERAERGQDEGYGLAGHDLEEERGGSDQEQAAQAAGGRPAPDELQQRAHPGALQHQPEQEQVARQQGGHQR